jgi:hypothetical protein
VIYIADDCPECQLASLVMRQTADRLANFAGGIVGGAVGARRGKPMEGAAIGSALAPRLIEEGAFAIRDFVKKPRKQTKGQKSRSKRMSSAMKKASSRARLKNGNFRAGWNQKKLMQTAHRLCK